MSGPAPQSDLLHTLGRLVRGLSALFWGLPLALVIGVQTARTDWLRPFGIVPPVAVSLLLLFGLRQLSHFQKQERVWIHAIDRTNLAALIGLGLSPFLYWWRQVPENDFFRFMVMILAINELVFLYLLNFVLQRLVAMLPDETLRHEIHLFTVINQCFLIAFVFFILTIFILMQFKNMPRFVHFYMVENGFLWLMVLVVLLPLAMTMALIWKTKEVILSSVFGPDCHPSAR